MQPPMGGSYWLALGRLQLIEAEGGQAVPAIEVASDEAVPGFRGSVNNIRPYTLTVSRID